MSYKRMIVFLFVAFSFLGVQSEYLIKKLCKDEPSSQCSVHSLQLSPCPHAPAFCTIKKQKIYPLTVDFTPAFTATRLELGIYGDAFNNGTYKLVKTAGDACDIITCPIDAGMRRIFDINLQLDKSFPIAKFPVKVKMWSEEDETKSCCFTFTVKVHK